MIKDFINISVTPTMGIYSHSQTVSILVHSSVILSLRPKGQHQYEVFIKPEYKEAIKKLCFRDPNVEIEAVSATIEVPF